MFLHSIRRRFALLLTAALAVAALDPTVASATDFKPTAPSSANASAVLADAYRTWKKTYLVPAGGPQLRVQRSAGDTYDTVSEGIAYGMLFSVYLNDRPTFDGLWAYARAHLDGKGLMTWRLGSDGNPTGANSATDADLDMAAALIAADTEWGGYSADAKGLIKIIQQVDVESGSNVLKPGDSWGGSRTVNPSYLSPAYFTAFAQYSGDQSWNDVRAAAYRVLAAIRQSDAGRTGFLPDWSTAAGGPADGMSYRYSYDASRLPLRLAMAANWDSSAEAAGYLHTLNATDKRLDLSSLASAYTLSGDAVGHGDSTPLLAAAAAAATVSQDGRLRGTSWQDLVGTADGGYFGDSMRLFGLLVASGTMVSPLRLSPAGPSTPSGSGSPTGPGGTGGPGGGSGSGGPDEGSTAATSYTFGGSSGSGPVGTAYSTRVAVSASAPTSDVIVDLEVYDAGGTRVAQSFAEHQQLGAQPASYPVTFTPSAAGRYTVRAGVFSTGWKSNRAWNSSVATVTASGQTGTSRLGPPE